MPHDYLAPLSALAATGRAVVFYDPLGSGSSARPPDTAWTLADYDGELDSLVAALELPAYHLFVHSAAGLAGYPHAFARPPGLRSLILASATASLPAYLASLRELLALSRAALQGFEQGELTRRRDAYFLRFIYQFIGAHFCRVVPLPVPYQSALKGYNPDAHRTLKGGWLFYNTELADWDVSARLGEIDVPTLITCGRHDVFTPAMGGALEARIPGSELAIFEHSSHMPHLEEPTAYFACLARFLDAHDAHDARS